jgi:hypothetical protein
MHMAGIDQFLDTSAAEFGTLPGDESVEALARV